MKQTERKKKGIPIYIIFEDIKTNILEIENLLKNIKDMKKKEEAELLEWEHEIQQAKTKLDQIDRTIFKKLD